MNKRVQFPKPFWLLSETGDKQTDFAVVLTSTCLSEDNIELAGQLLHDNEIVVKSSVVFSNGKVAEFSITTSTHQAWDLFRKFLSVAAKTGIDVAVIPVSTRKKKLLVCDMDSTIVQTETLDDIAAKIGIGKQVSEITARAMRGDLDFRRALDERVSLLKDMSEEIFDEIADTVQFNSGAETLLHSAQEHGIHTVLVSGGFEPIVKVVAGKLGFDRYVCNKMEVSNGRLTGKVLEPIVDGETKLKALMEECKRLTINPEQACAIGDGANDIPMLQTAGLGIGFKGKPLVRTSIPYQINSTGLESVLSVMGIVSR